MSAGKLSALNIRLRSLAVFRALLKDPVIAALARYLDGPHRKTVTAVDAYAAFVSALYAAGNTSLARCVLNAVTDDENPYICTIGEGKKPSAEMEQSVFAELETLQEVADLTPEYLQSGIDWDGKLPAFAVEKIDLAANYRERCANIGKYGYGIYAKHHMFYVDQAGDIVAVRNPDPVRLSSLVDYEREKKIILANTLALLAGKTAANVLLTGDAGTGKSSTIKAIGNELCEQGLRILEVRKEQLYEIPAILDRLAHNPLKFILFIDDLSFQKGDDNYSVLKAILEGSVSAKSRNVAIYATSNRRHLVKESFSDREGDDVHRNDTMQELISLSERFGIHVTFQKPSREGYLHIVRHLADERGIELAEGELTVLAERFALERGGRSARAAKQFVDGLSADEK